MVAQEACSPNFEEGLTVYLPQSQSELLMEAVDTLISARWVIPIEPAASVLERHTVVIRQGRIVDLLPSPEAAERYSAPENIDRPSHVLLPGFVNAHAAASLALLQKPPRSQDANTPAERRADDVHWTDPEFIRDSAELAMARMASSGTTCFGDHHMNPDIVARTAAALHLRACVGLPVFENATSWAASADEYFDKAAALHDEYRADPLITTVFTTGSVPSLTDGTLHRLQRAADEIELPIVVPLHESAAEIAESIARSGCRPLERLERLSLATPQLVGLHLTQLTTADIEIVARTGVHAVVSPRFNLYRQAGISPVSLLHGQEVNLALGTGGGPASDLQGELRLVALLAAGKADSGISAHDVLRMATLGGARALGLADSIGSLLPGKWADLCCIDLAVLQTQPIHDVLLQLVHTAEQDQVTDVWVAGRTLLVSGNLVRLDIAATVERAARWCP